MGAIILKGQYKGEGSVPTDAPFTVRLAFVRIINKSQRQSFIVCGINLENPCFSHGQLQLLVPVL